MLLSVVMPTFKHHDYIKASIKSILNQTCVDLELIVVPVFSDKKTLEIVSKFSDNRIKVVESNYALITHQMNLGAYAALGKWMMYFASDDKFYNNDSIEKIVKFSEKHNLSLAYPDFYIGDKKARAKKLKTNPEFDHKIPIRKSSYITDVSLIKREDFLKYLPMKFSDGKARIRNIWVDMVENKYYCNKIRRYPHPTFIYRTHKHSVHFHGSQSSFSTVQVGSIDNSIGLKRKSVKQLKKNHFCVYITDPQVYLENKKKFRYKKIVLYWDSNTISLISQINSLDRVYHVTENDIVYKILKENGLYYSRLVNDKCDLYKYVSSESIEDIHREIRFKHDNKAMLHCQSG